MVTLQDFLADPTGRRFADVVSDPRISFEQAAIDFLNEPARIVRLRDSEMHHDRPALAGVIVEFEQQPEVETFFSGNDNHTTTRFKQAVGVLVRLHMEKMGWRTTGNKGSLGTRSRVAVGTTAPGAYRNSSGLSRWFKTAERYKP